MANINDKLAAAALAAATILNRLQRVACLHTRDTAATTTNVLCALLLFSFSSSVE